MFAALLGISLFAIQSLPEPQVTVVEQFRRTVSEAASSARLAVCPYVPPSDCPECCWQADDDDDLVKEIKSLHSSVVQAQPWVNRRPSVPRIARCGCFRNLFSTMPDLIHVFCTLLI